MSDSKTASRSIYIDQSSAERSLEKLTGSMTKLEAEIAKGTKAGKDMATQIAKLSDTKKNIDQVKDALEKGLAPTFRQQQQLVRELDRSLKNMSESAPGYADKFKAYKNATGELERMKQSFKGVDDAQKEVVKNSSALTRAGAGIASFFGNLAANAVQGAVSAIGSFFAGSIEEAEQAEKSLSRLKNTLDNIGRGDAFDRITEKANDLANTFKFLDNDDITEVFQQLITYGKLTENQMNQLLPVIINFASKSGISVNDSAGVIIKSLEGNAKALKEYGISVKDGSNVTERFGILMSELAPKVEGAAKAFETTHEGIKAISEQDIANLKEDIGNQLLPVMNQFYQGLSTMIAGLKSIFSNTVNFAENVYNKLKLTADLAKDVLKGDVAGAFAKVAIVNGENDAAKKKVQQEKERAIIQEQVASFARATAKETIDEQEKILKQQVALRDASLKSLGEITKNGKFRRDEEHAAALQYIRDRDTVLAIEKNIAAAKDTRVLGNGDPNSDPAGAKKAADERKKAEEEAKARLEKYNEFIRGINSSITELLSPEASKKWVEILVKTTDEMDKLKKLTQNDQQYQEGKKRILEEQAAAVHRLFEEESKLYKAAPEQVSTTDPNSLPAGLRNSLPKAPIKARITIVPEITLADEKAASAAIAAAFDKLKRNNDAATRIAVNFGNPQERRDALLQDLEIQHDAEINSKTLTDNEKLEKEDEYQKRRKEIIVQYQDEIIGYIQEGLGFANQVVDILGKFNQAANNRENAQLKNELKGNDVKKASYKKLLDQKVIGQQEYNQKVNALDKEAETKKEALEKKQFERQKKLQIAQALINGAMAITSTLSAPPGPVDILSLGLVRAIQVGLVVATTAAEIATIASSKYGKGGKLNGPSHSSGGMPVINPDTGRKEAEVEGGEYILSKDTVRNNREIADALLFASMQRSGARVRPFWEKRPYSSLDYKGIARNMQTLRFAEGGIAPGKSTAADEATTATQTIVIENKDDEMKSLLRALTLRLSQPIEVSHTKIKDAYALEQRQLNDAALK